MAAVAMLNGCTNVVSNIAHGEGYNEINTFILTTRANEYIISRFWGSEATSLRTITIPRNNLPAGCTSARFFLNDSDHELKVASYGTSSWTTWERPPLPDDIYPPCALLIALGTFSGSPAFDGVAITSVAGLVAKDEIAKPQPAAWSLLPVEFVADTFLLIGGGVTAIATLPILLSYVSYKNEELEKKMDELPPPVKACKAAIDEKINNPDYIGQVNNTFTGFVWYPLQENAYVFTKADELFSDDEPVSIDSRVLLFSASVSVNLKKVTMWTDAEVDCGFQSGNIVATRVNILK
jgi:hypothetical protein